MDYLVTFEDGSSGYLSHFGVKGMHWGVWNAETAARYGKAVGKASAKYVEKPTNRNLKKLKRSVKRRVTNTTSEGFLVKSKKGLEASTIPLFGVAGAGIGATAGMAIGSFPGGTVGARAGLVAGLALGGASYKRSIKNDKDFQKRIEKINDISEKTLNEVIDESRKNYEDAEKAVDSVIKTGLRKTTK